MLKQAFVLGALCFESSLGWTLQRPVRPPSTVMRVTVRELKEMLRAKGLKVSGTKAELARRLEETESAIDDSQNSDKSSPGRGIEPTEVRRQQDPDSPLDSSDLRRDQRLTRVFELVEQVVESSESPVMPRAMFAAREDLLHPGAFEEALAARRAYLQETFDGLPGGLEQ